MARIMKRKKISILAPTFNEEDNVGEFYKRVNSAIHDLRKSYDFEIIFIDNASTDDTVKIIKKIAKTDKKLLLIENYRNFGHIRSPYWGVMQARGDSVITMASDLQYPPEIIPELIQKWEEGAKIVCAVKPVSDGNKLMHFLRRNYYILLNKLSDITLTNDYTGFGLIDKDVVNQLRLINDPYPYFRGLIHEFGYPISTVKFTQPRRLKGISKNNFYTLYDMAMLGLVSHSILPIRLASFLGFSLGILSIFISLGILIFKMIWWDSFATGQASILVLILMLFGILLVFVGMLGEYIGSIHTYVKNRPIVVEKDRTNF